MGTKPTKVRYQLQAVYRSSYTQLNYISPESGSVPWCCTGEEPLHLSVEESTIHVLPHRLPPGPLFHVRPSSWRLEVGGDFSTTTSTLESGGDGDALPLANRASRTRPRSLGCRPERDAPLAAASLRLRTIPTRRQAEGHTSRVRLGTGAGSEPRLSGGCAVRTPWNVCG